MIYLRGPRLQRMRDPLGWNKELNLRHEYRSRQIEGDIFEMVLGKNGEVKFYLTKPSYNPYDAINGYTPEEKFRVDFFYPYMNSDTILFDVGCAQGHYSFPALALGANVIGFEPDARVIPHLIANTELNGFKRFIICQILICNVPTCKVDVDELSCVAGTTIDDFVTQTGVIPTFIKIDVEGAENLVIEGAIETLKKYKPYVFVENHVLWVKDVDILVREKMEKIGYTFTDAGEIPWGERRNVVYSFFSFPFKS